MALSTGRVQRRVYCSQLDDTNKVSNHSVTKTSVGQLLEADVQPNFVAQLSGHKKFEKPRQLPFSISEATARNACYPESWAGYIRSVRRKPSQYLHYNTAKCPNSPTNPRGEANKIICFCFFVFLFGHIIKILLPRSLVQTSLRSVRYWRPRSRFSNTDLPLG